MNPGLLSGHPRHIEAQLNKRVNEINKMIENAEYLMGDTVMRTLDVPVTRINAEGTLLKTFKGIRSIQEHLGIPFSSNLGRELKYLIIDLKSLNNNPNTQIAMIRGALMIKKIIEFNTLGIKIDDLKI